jgi:hypothetical protein
MDESPLPAHPRLSFRFFFVFVFSIVRFLKIYKYCLQSSTHWVNAQLAIYGCDGPFALLSGWGLEGARWKDCKLDFSYLMTYLLSPVQRGFFLYISSWPMGNELFALHNTIFFIKYNFFIRTQIKIFLQQLRLRLKLSKKKSVNADAHNTQAHSPLWTHVRKPYPYEHLRRTALADLEIHEVTTGTSLSTGTSSTIESIAPLNPRINLGKYEHTYQVKDLNPGGQVPPQGT